MKFTRKWYTKLCNLVDPIPQKWRYKVKISIKRPQKGFGIEMVKSEQDALIRNLFYSQLSEHYTFMLKRGMRSNE